MGTPFLENAENIFLRAYILRAFCTIKKTMLLPLTIPGLPPACL